MLMEQLNHQYHQRISRLLALYAFGAHFHSGQASRGYRISCRAQKLLQRRAANYDWLAYIERLIERDSKLQAHNRCDPVRMYWELVDHYGDAV